MSTPEGQEGCGSCWAHAATGVVEGLLNKLHGSNIQIDLDEMDIVTNCTGIGNLKGLEFIRDSKVRSEQGLNTFPNYDKACYKIDSCSSSSSSTGIIISRMRRAVKYIRETKKN